MALYTFTSQDDFARLNRLPSPDQTQLYNMLGRNTGAQGGGGPLDSLAKKASSIENALGTTGAAVVSAIDTAREDQNIENRNKDNKTRMNDIAKKYGYNTYHDVWDARDRAVAAGDQATLDKIDNIINPELQGQANANKAEADKAAKNWKDYRENSYVGQKVNQDRGKFLGSAMNTLSTAADVMLPGTGVALNAVQGAWEGVADELEQNGLKNFDLGRAGQNALVGAATGGVTGALNKGLSNALAKNGGNLFAGNNVLSRGINKVANIPGPQRLLGKYGGKLGQAAEDAINAVGTGAIRGALSGAVGGATGAGLSAALNGQDVIGSAMQGAAQGARSGAATGGVMATANTILNDTPLMKDLNQAKQDWENSGGSFSERLRNTVENNDTWGNRMLSNIAEDGRAVKQGFQNVGEGLEILAERAGIKDIAKATPSDIINAVRGTGDEALLNEVLKNPDLRESIMNTLDNRTSIPLAESVDRINEVRGGEANFKTIGKLPVDLMSGSPGDIKPDIRYLGELANGKMAESAAVDGGHNISPQELGYATNNYSNSRILGFNDNGTDKLNIVKPMADNQNLLVGLNRQDDGNTVVTNFKRNADDSYMRNLQKNKGADVLYDTTSGAFPATADESASFRVVDRGADSTIPQSNQNVNGELFYGESELGNRTRRGMIAGGLERLGNTLEGAQTNVTRAAAKDLGIESTGKVVENVRRKTGITNLETQAAIAKELTGGANSLMDSVQKMALGAGEDGQPFAVDTKPVISKISQIVDSIADTNMFGSQGAKDKFIKNLKADLSVNGGDIMALANRMKANAADLRGKGVVSPNPSDAAKAKIYTKIASELDDLSYKAIPQENVEAMFDATISEMRGRATQAANNGNMDVARAYTKLADNLNAEPRTVKAFRSFKKDFVDVSKINDLTARAENGAAMQMGRGIGGGLKRFADTLLQRPVNAILAKAGGAVNTVANKISGEGGAPESPVPTPTAPTSASEPSVNASNPATRIYDMIGRREGLTNAEQARTADYLTEAAQDAQTPSATSLEQLAGQGAVGGSTSVYNSFNAPTASSPMGGSSANTGYFQPTGDYWTDMLGRAMSSAIDADDVTAFAALYGMYQDSLANLQKSSASSNKEVKLTDKQRQANAAERALNDFEGAEHNFAYDVSDIPVLGNIANLGGNEYASKAEALALQIGYMLSGATVNKDEAKNIGMAYVPQPRDNESVRKSKLAQLRGIISDYQKAYME